ncbi:uncharacterized protein LOC134262487, partial [Saccostrea cucullata]|uniref:uncharacterized protein LOC134262487 n=1 Tax=Saccostrea cuccullata TaxID=36930 RepID=UPI002ED3C8AC
MAEGGGGNDNPLTFDNVTEETTEMGSDFLIHENPNENPTVGMALLKDGVLSFLEDLDKTKDFLSCINCQQEFDNSRQSPLLLPCLTAICKKCVLVLLASKNTSIECPYCKCSHACAENGSITLPRDTIREGVLGIFHVMKGESDLRCEMCTGAQRASHRCFDCSLFICEECTKLHSSLRTFMNHSYVEIRSLLTRNKDSLKLFSPTLYCSIPGHEQKILEIFCSSESCKRLICLLCAVNAHKTHDLCEIPQVLSEKNKALRELKISLKTRNENLFKSLKELEEKRNASYTEPAQIEKEIKLCFSKAKLVLEKREKELCDVLKKKQNEREAAFELGKCRLSNIVDSRLQALHYVDASNALQCPSSFINISMYMESRLKSLESELPRGNSQSFEKINFIHKELDLLIDGAKRIGEIVTTKASSSKTEAFASPSTCAVGSEIVFTVKLKTSSGELINDESVQVCICRNGKPFKFIPCFYEKTSSYIGNWVPDKAMKSTWYILTNGIKLDLPRDGTLHVIDNCIIEKDVSKLDSVKALPEKMPKQSEQRNKRFESNETESDTSMSLSTVSSETFEVKVTDEFIVKIYQGSITKLRVDCIVNGANDKLMHGGGVALAIAEAAGYEFDRESVEYIRQHGPIPIGKCCVTSAGKLHYKCVIHTVGPRWHDYNNDGKKYCFDDLQEAVEVTFREAERLKMTSIAIPAISS